MKALHYLTVQDLLWINLQVLNKVRGYQFARLEEATFYQYAYGESSNLLPQAARFFPGFVRLKPFEVGNEATTFVAGLAFLTINGQHLTLKDSEGVEWFDHAVQTVLALKTIEGIAQPDEHAHHSQQGPNIRAAIRAVIDAYPLTVAALVARSAAVA